MSTICKDKRKRRNLFFKVKVNPIAGSAVGFISNFSKINPFKNKVFTIGKDNKIIPPPSKQYPKNWCIMIERKEKSRDEV